MARPRCWICFNQLMYVNGKPVFAVVVEDGIEHKCHKECAKHWKEDARKDREVTSQSKRRVRTQPQTLDMGVTEAPNKDASDV